MSKIAIITGANQGLGSALAEGLAQQLAPPTLFTSPAAASIASRLLPRGSPPRGPTSRGDVLDVRDGGAVTAFANTIRERHGGVDIVFSNVAARLTPATPWGQLVGPFVDTNNLGTTRLLRALDPILRPGGRLLVVASSFGSLCRLAHICTSASTPR